MTLLPSKIGDKGQRYVIKGRLHENAPIVEFAYANTVEAAKRWIRSMRSHPSWCDFEVYDRSKKAKKKK